MSEPTIPPAAKLAAKRAFIRTTAQGYATSVTGSLAISVVSLITNPGDYLIVVVSVVTAAVTPLAAGAAAYFQWLAKGIPEDYKEAVVTEDAPDVLQRAWQAQVARNQAAIDAEGTGE